MRLYNVPDMGKPQVDVTQLLQKDTNAWTAVLRRHLRQDDVTVTAVASTPLHNETDKRYKPHLIRYSLTLDEHPEPVTCIGKRTNEIEACFYRDIAPLYPFTPTCWYTHVYGHESWVILEDIPDHYPQATWTTADVQEIIQHMAGLHAPTWNQPTTLAQYEWLPHLFVPKHHHYTWDDLQEEHKLLLTKGPGSIISEHAIYHAGRMAPAFLQAANGLAVMRSLNGWPGILGESHLAAAADLLDDPVPLLDTLKQLPTTLLHGAMHAYHWHSTLFADYHLLDWQHVCTGPGVWDLVYFSEWVDLLHEPDQPWQWRSRDESPCSEETIIDSYMLAMRARLGTEFNARQVRQAIAAARCLYVLTAWFPHFATWFAEMPNAYTWQRVNRLRDQDLLGTRFETIIGYRTHLRGVFERFLHAYHTL
ncbi:MAG: hypothetical protein H6660_09720 [Ardenticatenaceae bacterium]|nr:hypothetical protein [Ardenticatenaceae bacterium]